MDARRAAVLIAGRIAELERSGGRFVAEGVVLGDDGSYVDDGVTTDAAEVGGELVERETQHHVLEHMERELAELRAAEARLVAGTYGMCERCGEPIADERLEAIPWARACAAHAR
jgi:RNA polymerase-binding transcription factor DksA